MSLKEHRSFIFGYQIAPIWIFVRNSDDVLVVCFLTAAEVGANLSKIGFVILVTPEQEQNVQFLSQGRGNFLILCDFF